MKNRNINIIFLMIWAIIGTACYDDEGNYTYRDINEVSIGGILTDQKYEKFAFVDTLRINPEIEGSFYNKNTEHYTFEWKLIPSVGASDTVNYVVSTEKDLILPITQRAGEYYGFFKVTDKVENTDWRAEFRLRVKTLTSEGWMVLCESDGEARLDLIANVSESEDWVARDLWQEKDYNLGRPYAIYFDYDVNRSVTLMCCESGTYALDGDMDAGEANNLKWMFGSTPDRVSVIGSASDELTYDYPSEFLVIEPGDLYVRNWLTYGSFFEFPINYLDGERFEVSPCIGMPWVDFKVDGWWSVYGHSTLLYDNTHLQFIELREGATKPNVMKFTNNNYFQAKTGREMVYVQSTLTNYTYAILKDPGDENYYLYKMQLMGDGRNVQEDLITLLPANSDKINKFAFHPIHPILYYATDHEIFKFDMRTPEVKAKSVLHFPDEVITVLKFNPMVSWTAYENWEKDRQKLLVVGKNKIGKDEEICGTVEFYSQSVPNAELKLEKHISELGKIVDITYRER